MRIYKNPLTIGVFASTETVTEIELDSAKNEANLAKHSLALEEFDGFDAEPVMLLDDRRDYGEVRYRAFGRIDGKGHAIAFTVTQSGLRLISFRRAHEKEMRKYEQASDRH